MKRIGSRLEFLAPEAEIRQDLRTLTFARLPALKLYWRISMIALVRAASVLGAQPPNKIKSMYVQISRNGWRRSEPHALSAEIPATVQQAIEVHFNEHGYTPEQLASVIDLQPEEFNALYAPQSDGRRLRAVT